MNNDKLFQTAMHEAHLAAGANMFEHEGWLLPEHYGNVDGEVEAVKNQAGVFDSSHLGRIRIKGNDAVELLSRCCTADVIHQEDDTALLTAVCDEAGKTIDVCFVIRLSNFWVLTTNAATRPAVLAHFQKQAETLDATADDQTFKTSMITVAGPKAPDLLDLVVPIKVADLPRRAVKTGSMMLARYIATRTGSTGLWSIEVMIPNMLVGQAWRFITKKAGENCLPPIGIAAREILRKDADILAPTDFADTDPISAGLENLLDFNHDFLGRESLQAKRQAD